MMCLLYNNKIKKNKNKIFTIKNKKNKIKTLKCQLLIYKNLKMEISLLNKKCKKNKMIDIILQIY